MQPFLDNDELVAAIIASVRDRLASRGGWEALDARIAASLQSNVSLPLSWLRTRQGLSATEERVLWFMIAHELDAEVRHAIRQLGTEELPDVTLGTLQQLAYAGSARLLGWRELGASGRLRSMRYLVRTDEAREAPQQRQTFRVAPRILALAHGEIGLDEELQAFASVPTSMARVEELVLDPATVDAVKAAMTRCDGLLVAYGRKGSGRRSLLAAGAATSGRRTPITVDARHLSVDANICAEQLRAIKRECVLLERLPLISFADSLHASSGAAERVNDLETAREIV